MGFEGGRETPDVTALALGAKSVVDALAANVALPADLASKDEGPPLRSAAGTQRGRSELGGVAGHRERVLANGELEVFGVDSYLRMAVIVDPASLANALAYLESLRRGHVAKQRLGTLMAGGHVAPDALAPTGSAA